MMTGVSQQFCVRWNSHLGSLGAAFPELLAGQRFVDVTLACDGHQVHCHRLVLAACSTYFESLLNENPCKHPIIILPKDVRLWEIQALVDFMYKGQVNVSQAGLPQLLKCAETLQIRGLCGTDSTLNEVSSKVERTSTNAATNLLPNCSSLNFSFAPNFASNCQTQHEHDDRLNQSGGVRVGNNASDKHASSSQCKRTKSNENLVKMPRTNANDMNKGVTVGGPSHGFADVKRAKVNSNEESDPAADVTADLCTELQIKNEGIDSDGNNQDDGMDDDMDQSNSKMQSDHDQQDVVIMHLDNLNHNSSDSCTSKNDLNQSKSAQSHHDFDHNATIDRIHEIAISSDSESQYSLGHKQLPSSASPSSSTLISVVDNSMSTKLATVDASSTTLMTVGAATESCTPSPSIPSVSHNGGDGGSGGGGGIRVKPIQNLFIGGRGGCVIDRNDRFGSEVHDVPAAKEFEGDGDDEDDDNSGDPVRNWLESSGHTKRIDDTIYTSNYTDDADGSVEFIENQYLPSSLKFDSKSMSIYVKSTKTNRNSRATESNLTHITDGGGADNEPECENIICSPNFMPAPFMRNDDEDDDDDESEMETSSTPPAMAMQAQTMRRLKYMLTKKDTNDPFGGHGSKTHSMHDFDTGQDNHVSQLMPYEIVGQPYHDQLNESLNDADDMKVDDELLLMPMHSKRATAPRRIRKAHGVDHLRNINFLKMYQAAAVAAANSSKQGKSENGHAMNSNPMRNAVVLRNPRGNQPRTYNTDALYAALMDVKSGESIYRASQIHKVPRKTLRNWMKRWDIKSVYPMPYQLKQAAEKKRQTTTKDNHPQRKPK